MFILYIIYVCNYENAVTKIQLKNPRNPGFCTFRSSSCHHMTPSHRVILDEQIHTVKDVSDTPLLPIQWQTARNIREAVSAIASCHLWIHLNLVPENLVHMNPPFLLCGSRLLWRVYALTLNPFSAFGAYFPPQPHQQSHTVPLVRLADSNCYHCGSFKALFLHQIL